MDGEVKQVAMNMRLKFRGRSGLEFKTSKVISMQTVFKAKRVDLIHRESVVG